MEQPTNRLWKNRYLIDRELGRGGFGVVYLARDEQLLSKRVVIKVLQDESTPDPYFQKKFQQEIEALARIDHPGVVGVLDVGETPEGRPFLVMQYIEGVTLSGEIGENGMDFRRIAQIVRQVSHALGAAHDKGIYHRDLKPDNIMLTRSGETEEYVKLIDFGIAAVMDSQVASKAEPSKVVGTLSYMAPEQVMGKGGAASDVYSFGVIVFEMLTGRRPDVSPNGVSVRPSALRPDIPEAAEATILQALSYHPENRPASPRHFGDQLCRALDGEPASKRPPVTIRLPQPNSPGEPEMAYVLFMDIIAYSKLPMDLQSQRIQQLQQVVRGSAEFQRALQRDQLVSLPTGDGMALVFFHNPISPVQCAIEVSRALKSHPGIALRMGIHTGPVYRIADINTNRNVAGGGINLAQRVMDCGDAGHILLSKTVADILVQLSDWAPMLHDLGEAEVKHGVRVNVVNLLTAEVGNPETPEKLRPGRKASAAIAARGSAGTSRRRTAVLALGLLFLLIAGAALYWFSPRPVQQTAQKTNAPPATLITPTGEMVLIPAGQYLSGPDKKPVTLPAFYIDRTEVTNDSYGRFCSATKREPPSGLLQAQPDFPVVNITIDQAREFARWAGKRLPVLNEWEKAARGTEGREYPWGNDAHFTGANVGSETGSPQTRSLASVSAFASGDSPWGVRQMAGNVWELIDELRPPSKDALDSFRQNSGLVPPPASTDSWYLIVGGSYEDPPQALYEFGHVPSRFSSERIGFRCVKDAQ